MSKKPTKNTHGGAGRNQGRKLKYGEPVKRLMFQIPESKVEHITNLVKKELKKWEVKHD